MGLWNSDLFSTKMTPERREYARKRYQDSHEQHIGKVAFAIGAVVVALSSAFLLIKALL